MAYNVELQRAGALAQFIYVWPSRELMSRSWSWPASWHEAFQDAAGRLGLAVALYGLDGRRVTRRLVSLQLSIGSVEFRLKRRGTSIFVTVSDFEASTVRGPDNRDGTRQPGSVDGLVLGLHGSDRGCYVVVFHGQIPTVPADMSMRLGKSRLTSGFSLRRPRAGGRERMPTGLRVLGGRPKGGHAGEKSAGFVESGKKIGNRAVILKSGTLALGNIPPRLSSPILQLDGTTTLHWTLFWCTQRPSRKAAPVFSTHIRQDASPDRRPDLDRIPFDPAGSRYLH